MREQPGVLLVALDRRRRSVHRSRSWRWSGSGPAGRTCARRNGVARASSSSGWTGGLARLMSSGGSTRPLPKSCAQTQLAIARAKYGFSGAVIQSASALRGSSSGGDLDGLAVEEVRLGRLLGPQVDDFALGIDLDLVAAHHRPGPPRRRAGPWRRRRPGRSRRPGSRCRRDGRGTGRIASGGPGIAARSARPARWASGIQRIVDRPAVVDVVGVADGGQQRPDHDVPGPVLGQALVDPGLVARGPVALARVLIWSRSPSLILQNSRNSFLPSSRSMSLVRFSGSVSARKLRTSSGVGCSPVRSSETRRRNAASPDGGLGGTLSDSSRLKSSSSMKLRRLSLEKSKARPGLMTVESRVFRRRATHTARSGRSRRGGAG